MGTNLNFKNFTNDYSDAGGGGGTGNRQPNFLDRQSSVYSLTFDEFQNTMGGVGKDFGSMNMDELLKNIWSAEEMQNMVASSSAAQEGLQRQGSLTLPRTLSQKTVDEVWKDISKEDCNGSNTGGAVVPQRQQTLGEMTLEEFLVRAGVVREDAQVNGKVNNANGGFFGELSMSGKNAVIEMGFQQNRGLGLNSINNNNNTNQQISLQSPILPLNVNGVRSTQTHVQHQQNQQHLHQHQHQHQHQQIFPKQPNLGYNAQLPLQISPGIRGGIMGIGDQGISGGPIQGGGMGMVGLGVATGSPGNQISSDTKSNGDTSSVSPVPYVFHQGVRGRRPGGGVEKVVERRQRRMIKNRESAARSRARKQAYTMELETEVARLKEENQELRKKQEEMMEMQKNQVAETVNQKQVKRHCLRRTQTGPW